MGIRAKRGGQNETAEIFGRYAAEISKSIQDLVKLVTSGGEFTSKDVEDVKTELAITTFALDEQKKDIRKMMKSVEDIKNMMLSYSGQKDSQ